MEINTPKQKRRIKLKRKERKTTPTKFKPIAAPKDTPPSIRAAYQRLVTIPGEMCATGNVPQRVIAVAFSVFSMAMNDRYDRPLNNNLQGAFSPPTSRGGPSCHDRKHVPAVTPLQWVMQTDPRPIVYRDLHLERGQGAQTWAGVTYSENFQQYVLIAAAARLKYLGGTPNRRQRDVGVSK